MIYITGDTHGTHDGYKLHFLQCEAPRNLTRDDYVIVCGDFGYVWFGNGRDDKFLDKLAKLPYTLLYCDGNHENFAAYRDTEKYPIVDFLEGKAQMIRPNVYHLLRGECYMIDGKSFFVMGGASSIDKLWRIENVSWWADEIPSEEEKLHAEHTLAKLGHKVDYIITHCMPYTCLQYADHAGIFHSHHAPEADEANEFLDSVMATTEYEHWFCGHYHINATVHAHRLTALYNDFVRLDLLDKYISRTK